MNLVTTKFKSGGLYEKHVVATWNLETISAFAEMIRRKEHNVSIFFIISGSSESQSSLEWF